jgi:O-Antigen ligase
MATNVDQPGTADVANSLLFGGGLKIHPLPEGGDRKGSIWLVVAPTVFVLALLVLATAYAGAFNIRQWAPPALFILLMIFTLVLRGGAWRLPDRWLGLALVGAWGLAGWAALSVTWAASPGAALEGAGRETLYAAIITVPLVAIGDLRALRVAGRGVVGGIALIAFYTLGRMLIDGPSIFLAGRLNGPVEYRNATALLFCLAYWPLIVTAATRGRGRVLRAICFGLAELMLGLAFLTQSRGVLLGLGCGALVALVLGPDRIRRAWLALLGVVLLAGASSWLLEPYHAFAGGRGLVSGGDILTAARALLALVCASVVVGFLLAVFDAGLRAASPALSGVRVVARLGLVAVLVAGLAGGWAAVHGDPVHELRVEWREFKSLQTTSTSATRYTSAGGQRYDLWRIALLELRSHPVGGVGEGSYQFDYYRQRRTDRNLDDPHGLLFQLGAELGVVGLALFALILIGFVGSLSRSWRLAPLDVRRSVCGLTAAGATFIGQSLVDWMWRIPGLTGLGVLCLAVAAALLARSASEHRSGDRLPVAASTYENISSPSAGNGGALAPALSAYSIQSVFNPSLSSRTTGKLWSRAAAGVVLLASVALVLSLYLSDFYVRRARDEAGHSPAAQLADARTASDLDPWSTDPHYLEASALESMGTRASARLQLEDASRLEPTSFVSLGLLGDFEARGRSFAKARVYYRRALALDPLDVGLQQLARSGGRPSSS